MIHRDEKDEWDGDRRLHVSRSRNGCKATAGPANAGAQSFSVELRSNSEAPFAAPLGPT
jgi:hypothetical protein